jgi:hypothetical protein
MKTKLEKLENSFETSEKKVKPKPMLRFRSSVEITTKPTTSTESF